MSDLKNLAKVIIASHEGRARTIQKIAEDTEKLIENFKNQREEMSKELQEALAKSQSLRKKDFNKMMQEIVLAQHKREKAVEEMLSNFRKEQVTMAERLQTLLGRGQNIRLADFKKTLFAIKKDQIKRDAENTGEQIKNELIQTREGIYKMLENFKQEIKK